MSTKNLARTVIEGGRYHGNTVDRRRSHRTAQAAVRVLLVRVLHDHELAECAFFPVRKPVGRSFHDKLAAADRWMRAQVGRPWRKVEGELLALFDTKTIAGQHIVFDHMLPRHGYPHDGTWRVGRTRFGVDEHGLLRIEPPRRWRLCVHGPTASEIAAAEQWAKGRKVRILGKRAYWLEPTNPECDLSERRYRQGRALTPRERQLLDTLSVACRELVLG